MNLINYFSNSNLKKFIIKHSQRLVSIYVFFNIAIYYVWNLYTNWDTISWSIIEITFLIHNIIMLLLFLIRKNYKSIDKNIFHQFIAAFAFFSGIAFSGQIQSDLEILNFISGLFIFISYLLGLLSLINLGTSFGVLIANREIKTHGVYSIIRHPMYFTDILFRIAYVLSHFNFFTFLLLIISSAAYVYRAILEENLLSLDSTYLEYMKKVKYRFIPYIY